MEMEIKMNIEELEEIRKITDRGNPGKPEGESGGQMLRRMNEEHADLTEWGLSFLRPEENNKILDIGCGGGAALKRLIAAYPGCDFYGLDHSELSIEQTKENNAAAVEEGRLHTAHGSVEKMPYESETFDRIYTVESFYFWPSAVGCLREVRRTLAQGGRFCLISEIYEHPGLSDIARENVAKYKMRNPARGAFEKYLIEAGFKNVEINIHPDEGWICCVGIRQD